jgi:hypothetical protein
MVARSYRQRVVAFTRVVLLVPIVACATEPLPGAGECIEGRAIACTCDDGSLGARTCAADGWFTACACAAPSSGGQGGVSAPPLGGSAGTSGAAAGGSSGQGVASDDGAFPDAGDGDIDGMPATDAGAIDASDGDMTDGGIVEAPEPKPGETYGPCHADGTCDASLFCTLDPTSGGAATYCTMFCSLSGFGPMCPAQPSGMPGTCFSNVCTR